MRRQWLLHRSPRRRIIIVLEDYKYMFFFFYRDLKLIILGAANIGKTCLLQRYLTGDFAETISVSPIRLLDSITCIYIYL